MAEILCFFQDDQWLEEFLLKHILFSWANHNKFLEFIFRKIVVGSSERPISTKLNSKNFVAFA